MPALTKSAGFSALLLVLALIQATLQSPVSASEFEGDYKLLSVSPPTCATNGCGYQCALAYKITVSSMIATLYPTTNPSGCICWTLFAVIIGDTATGTGLDSVYSFKRTSTGLEVVVQASSLVCSATYTATSSSSTSTTSSATPTATSSSSTSTTSSATPTATSSSSTSTTSSATPTSTASSSTTSPVTSPTGSITSTTPATTTGISITSTTAPTSGVIIPRSGAAQSSGYMRALGWMLTASSALALCCL